MQKVVPSERLRRELDDVLNGITEEEDPIEAVARLGARLILQQALEDEVTEFVGRARYERAEGGGEVIYRNGFAEPSTVRTTSGATVIERPRVRDATKVGFASQVLGCLKLMNVDFKDPRVNPNGGAIAIGHPLGCSGARLALTVSRPSGVLR